MQYSNFSVADSKLAFPNIIHPILRALSDNPRLGLTI